MSHLPSKATGRDVANRKKSRHSWDKKGNWDGSKDVRACLKCGVKAFRTGLYSGWDVDGVFSERMPACQGVDLAGLT